MQRTADRHGRTRLALPWIAHSDAYVQTVRLQKELYVTPGRVVSFSFSELKWTVQSDNIPFAADNLYTWRGRVFVSGRIKMRSRKNDLIPA